MSAKTLEELKENLDLLAEIENDLGPGKKSGRWIKFHCPFHQDKTPSLCVTDDNGRWYCFSCGRSGDIFNWFLEYRKLSWKDIYNLEGSRPLAPKREPQPEPEPQPGGPPDEAWQCLIKSLVESWTRNLWGSEGAKALNYLHKRGFDDRTIQHYRLGYVPRDERYNGIWLDRGISIPCFISGALWSVKIRRPANDPKYRTIKAEGSQAALFGADNLRGVDIALITEGEFDCMLVDQMIGDVVGAATMGSATAGLDVATWGSYLLPAKAILIALDTDEAGKEGIKKWLKKSAQMHLVRVPVLRSGDKDITDYCLAGGDLWEWLKYDLDRLGILAELGLGNPERATLPADWLVLQDREGTCPF